MTNPKMERLIAQAQNLVFFCEDSGLEVLCTECPFLLADTDECAIEKITANLKEQHTA